MHKQLLRALLAMLLFGGLIPAGAAQTLSSSPEVGTYVPQTVEFVDIASGLSPILGDGSANGGVAPAFSLHPQPVDPNQDMTGWVGPTAAGQNCLTVTVIDGSKCYEKKARFTSNGCLTGYKKDDPIRYWGQPGVSHLHEFFNSCETNARSTYQSLRLANRVPHVGAGGIVNGSGYWEPAWQKKIAGKTYAIPASSNTFYYFDQPPLNTPLVDDLQPLHLLMRFIGGVNMDDPDDLRVKAELAAANALPGGSSYEYMGNGFAGYVCIPPDNHSIEVIPEARYNPALKEYSAGFTTLDGKDPWHGECVAGSMIYAEANSPTCWDGVNVSSPTGYDHVRFGFRDATSRLPGRMCPKHWFKLPVFQLKTMHDTQGFDDYKTWFLASDAMMASKVGRAVVPGASFHFDWMNGWNSLALNRWLSFCLGVGTNTPHDCNSSALDDELTLLTGGISPDGRRSPQVDLSFHVNTNDVKQLHLVGDTKATMIHAH